MSNHLKIVPPKKFHPTTLQLFNPPSSGFHSKLQKGRESEIVELCFNDMR